MPKLKYMENSVTINPQTPQMAERANALRIKNEFIKLGFETKAAFFEVVQQYLPTFKDYHKANELHNWWLLRGKHPDMNEKLETVLNKLRHE